MHVRAVILTVLLVASLCGNAFGRGTADAPTIYYLLIDVSSSMSQRPVGWQRSILAEAQHQLADFTSSLPAGSRVVVYTFATSPPTPGPRVTITTEDDRATLRQFFRALRAPGRATHAWSSLEAVLAEIRSSIEREPGLSIRLLMYTDGQDNQRPRRNLDAILESYRDLLTGPVETTFITLGFTLERREQQSLAEGNVRVVPVLDPTEFIPLRAAFTWSPRQPMVGDSVQFVDQSEGGPTEYHWSFGDDAEASARSPAHVFDEPGRVEVRLTIRRGNRTLEAAREIDVAPIDEVEPAWRVFPDEAVLGQGVQFINDTKGVVESVLWKFGDGATSTEFNPQHTYVREGTYSPRLTVTVRGVSRSLDRENAVRIVQADPPEVDFDHAQRIELGEAAQFVDRSRGLVDTRAWDFGDGGSSTEIAPVHEYAAPGEYTVTLTCEGPGGRATRAHTITVVPPQAPRAMFEVGAEIVRAGELVRFIDLSSGVIAGTTWSWGDGSEPIEVDATDDEEASARPATHIFRDAGEYAVTLTVHGPGGSDDFTRQVVVEGHAPLRAAIRSVPGEAAVNEPVDLIDLSTGPVSQVTWTFGDGTDPVEVSYETGAADTAKSVEHVYSTPGTFLVRLEVVAVDGRRDIATLELQVAAPTKPTAAYVVGSNVLRVDDEITFVDVSSGTVDSATWEFGDGSAPQEVLYTVDSARHVSHRFTAAGEYIVRLTVHGPGGVDTAAQSVTVRSPDLPVVVGFEASPTKARGHEVAVRFRNTSTGSISRFIWDFGDETEPLIQTVLEDVQHIFTPGEWTVTLTVESSAGFPAARDRVEINIREPVPASAWILLVAGLAVLAGIFLGYRSISNARAIRVARRISGDLEFKPLNQARIHTQPLQQVESPAVFDIADPDGGSVTYTCTFSKTLDSLSDLPRYTLSMARDGREIDTATIEPGDESTVGPFRVMYTD